MEIIDVFSSLFEPCYDLPQSSLKNFAEEFIRERNGLGDISITNNSPNLMDFAYKSAAVVCFVSRRPGSPGSLTPPLQKPASISSNNQRKGL
jgi:hypothetical protein